MEVSIRVFPVRKNTTHLKQHLHLEPQCEMNDFSGNLTYASENSKGMSLRLSMMSRLTSLLALLLSGCAPILNIANSAYDFCSSNTKSYTQYYGSPNAEDLVVFMHELCGNAKTTWTNPSTHFVFPDELARDFSKENQSAYVVAFDYVSRLNEGQSILSIADHFESRSTNC